MTHRILVTDKVALSGLYPLVDHDQFDVTSIDDSTSHEFQMALADAEALIVRSATKVTGEMLSLQLPSGRSVEDLLAEAKAQMVAVSLGTELELKQAGETTITLEQGGQRHQTTLDAIASERHGLSEVSRDGVATLEPRP